MMVYNARIASTTLGATTTAIATLIAGAARSLLLMEFDFQGRGTASADNEVGIFRVGTAGVTGSGAITPQPVDSPNMTGTTPAIVFSGTMFGTYATQPITGVLAHSIPLNANGQRYFWRANPSLNNAIVVPGGNSAAASVAIFPIAGTSNVSGRIQFGEL